MTNLGGYVYFNVVLNAAANELFVEEGTIATGASNCVEPHGSSYAASFAVGITTTPIHQLGFDMEKTDDEAAFRMNLTMIGRFTSSTDVQGTATMVVISAEPPYTQCTITPPALTWTAKRD